MTSFVLASVVLILQGTSAFYNSRLSIYQNIDTARTTVTTLSNSVHEKDIPNQCYLIQTELDSGEVPQVVCTNNIEEYAWFHGISQDRLIMTDSIYDKALQCVEGESTRGTPEWECDAGFL